MGISQPGNVLIVTITLTETLIDIQWEAGFYYLQKQLFSGKVP